MLSIEECQILLNSVGDETYTKDEATKLRESLSAFADIAFEAFNKELDKDELSDIKRKKSPVILSC